MAFRHIGAALLVAILAAFTAAFVSQLQAQGNCGQAFDKLQQEIEAFDQAAKNQNADFLAGGLQDSVLHDAKVWTQDQHLSQVGMRQAPIELQFEKNNIQTYDQVAGAFHARIEDMETGCALKKFENALSGGTDYVSWGACLREFGKNQSAAFKRWIESLALSGNAQAAMGRVRSVRAIMDNHMNRLHSVAQGGINSALSCIDQSIQRVKAAQDTQDAVDARRAAAKPTPTPAPPHPVSSGGTGGTGGNGGSGGGSIGKALGIGAGIAGAAVAANYYYDHKQSNSSDSNSSGDCPGLQQSGGINAAIGNTRGICGISHGTSACATAVAQTSACCKSIGFSGYTEGATACH